MDAKISERGDFALERVHPNPITFRQLYHGRADWETVHLDQRLDRRLILEGTKIECHVDVRGSFPSNFLSAYRWTTVLTAVSNDGLRLVKTRRQRDTL